MYRFYSSWEYYYKIIHANTVYGNHTCNEQLCGHKTVWTMQYIYIYNWLHLSTQVFDTSLVVRTQVAPKSWHIKCKQRLHLYTHTSGAAGMEWFAHPNAFGHPGLTWAVKWVARWFTLDLGNWKWSRSGKNIIPNLGTSHPDENLGRNDTILIVEWLWTTMRSRDQENLWLNQLPAEQPRGSCHPTAPRHQNQRPHEREGSGNSGLLVHSSRHHIATVTVAVGVSWWDVVSGGVSGVHLFLPEIIMDSAGLTDQYPGSSHIFAGCYPLFSTINHY